MLSDEDKLRIAEEERVRQEIRQERKPNVGALSRIWQLLNSAIFLWLLSSVVVGFVVHVYNQRVDSRARQGAMSESARRIAIELRYRCQSCRQLIGKEQSKTNPDFGRAALALDGVTSGFVFPEHQGRSLTSLAYEYEGTLAGRELKPSRLTFLPGLPTTSEKLLENLSDDEKRSHLTETVAQIETQIVNRELE